MKWSLLKLVPRRGISLEHSRLLQCVAKVGNRLDSQMEMRISHAAYMGTSAEGWAAFQTILPRPTTTSTNLRITSVSEPCH